MPLVDALLEAGQNFLTTSTLTRREKIESFFRQVKLLEEGYPGDSRVREAS